MCNTASDNKSAHHALQQTQKLIHVWFVFAILRSVPCVSKRWCTPPSSSLRWSKYNITAQHIFDALQHHVGLMLQAPVLTMKVQQG